VFDFFLTGTGLSQTH